MFRLLHCVLVAVTVTFGVSLGRAQSTHDVPSHAVTDACVPPSDPPSRPAEHLPDGMVFIHGGSIRFGGQTVWVSSFVLDRTEVTVAQWRLCTSAGHCEGLPDPWHRRTDPRTAVTDITWTQALGYCTWAGRRLPTEAEFVVAVGGVSGPTYPWGEALPDCVRARVAGCGDGPLLVGVHPAGSAPSGAMDLVGNVAEWVSDFFAPLPTGGCAVNPTGPPTGTLRTVRGGSFVSVPARVEASAREGINPSERRFDVGFRCARGL